MILTPAAYDEAVYSSHELYTEVRVLGQGTDDTVIYPDGGSVTLDLTAAVRGNCQLQFSDPDLIPMDASDPLAPFGNELQVSRGLRTPDGFEHLVPLGIFMIQDTAVTASTTGINIDVTASDRAQGVVDAVFEADFEIAGGQNYTNTILSVVSGGVTVAETDFITMTGSTTTSPGFQGDDRWAFAQDMAAFIGCDLFWSNTGVLTLKRISTIGSSPVAEITEGEDGVDVYPNLLDISRTWSRREAHNKWIVVGVNPDDATGTGPPPTATAIDDDPTSPTYYYGPFGRKPEIWHSSFVEDAAQALDAAEGKKAKEIGLTQEINFGSLVNPALEPGDVVHVKRTLTYENETLEVANESHIIDSLTIPLDAGTPMQGRTRAIRALDV